MIRTVAGAVLGVVIAGLIVFGIEALGHQIYPLPAGLQPDDFSGLAAYLATAPTGALVMVIAAWVTGTLIGTSAAMLIAGGNWIAGAVAGAINTGFAVMTVSLVPHPTWMVVTGIGLTALAALGAVLLWRRT